MDVHMNTLGQVREEMDLNPVDRDTVTSVNLLRVNQDELRTIVAGLMEYRKALHGTLEHVARQREEGTHFEPIAHPGGLVSGGFKDEAFCYGELAKIANVLFAIGYDHSPVERTHLMQRFLDGVMDT
jgi:hypothetical protein